jgi:hypothetical protein
MTDFNNNLFETDNSTKTINTTLNNNILHDIKENRGKKLIYSNSMDNLLKNDNNWAEEINKYYNDKKILKWGYNPKQELVKEKHVKSQDLVFNPITQKYSDKNIEKELRRQEKSNMINSIAQGYDNELRVIQTFDIINLKDKLNTLKNNSDYLNDIKQYHGAKRKKLNISSGERNYNILSNINLNLHHFDKPENRPLIKDEINNKKKIKLGSFVEYKDYDIISNKYNNFDKEKRELDLKLSIAEISNKYLKSRDYDAIKGIYVDSEKEKKFQEELKNKIEKIKNIKRDTIFNPFNNEIYNKEKYDELNQKEKNRIYRYTIKQKMDNYYHQAELKNDIIKNNSLKTKVSYNKFKEIDKRGYDILNGKNNFNHYKNSLECRNIQRPWEMIKNGLNENQTIKFKKIYDCYDYEDVNQRFKDNEIKRKRMLNSLPKIEDEKIFSMKKQVPKINLKRNSSVVFNKRYEIFDNNKNKFNVDKNLWFSREKEIFLNHN